MKYIFNIDHITRTANGNPTVDFRCQHCGSYGHNFVTYLYRANLTVSPRDSLAEACDEFCTRVNAGQFDALFFKVRTGRAFSTLCCHCIHNVKDIDLARGVQRARGVLLRGLEILAKKENGGAA
jgi:hypothetical protein